MKQYDGPIPLCGKGTMHGQAAMRSQYGFAACTLPEGHGGRCDSGPVEPEPVRKAA